MDQPLPSRWPAGAWRRGWAVCLGFALILLAGFGFRIFSADLIWAADLRQQFVIWLDYFRWSVLDQGLPPYWDPFTFAGRPFLASLQPASFYPPVFVLALLFSATRAVNLLIFGHLVWAGAGMFRLARHYSRSGSAGFVAGMVYAGSGYLITCVAWGHLTMVMTAAWLPFIIHYLELHHETRQRRWLGWLAIALALQFLAGHPQVSYYTLLLLFARHLWLTWRRPEPAAARIRLFLPPLVALVLAAGLAAPQLLPTAELLRQSTRLDAVEDYRVFTYWSLDPRSFVRIVMPYFYGSVRGGDYWRAIRPNLAGYEEYYLSLGVIPLLLIVNLLLGRRWRDPCGFYFAVLPVTLLLALGKYTPLCRLAYDWFPGFHLFRWPVRLLILYSFAGSLLAGFGWQRFWSDRREARPAAAIAVLGAALVIGAAGWWLIGRQRVTPEQLSGLRNTILLSGFWLAFFLTGFLAVVFLRRRYPARAGFARIALLLLMVAELVLFVRGFAAYYDPPLYPELGALARAIPAGARAWIDPGLAWRNAGTLSRIPTVDGYDPFVLDRYARFIRPAAGRDADENNPLGTLEYNAEPFRRLGVDFLIFRPGLVPNPAEWEPRAVAAAAALYRRRGASDSRLLPAAGVPAPALLSDEERPDRFRAVIEAPGGGRVALNRVWYPGWEITLNGQPVSVTLRDGLFPEFELPAGRAALEYRYQPTIFRAGLAAGLLSLLLGLLAVRARRGPPR